MFKELFNYAKSLAAKKSIKKFKLYAEESNTKAKNTYMHLGMTVSEDRFFGYDLHLGEKILFLDNPLLKVRKMDE